MTPFDRTQGDFIVMSLVTLAPSCTVSECSNKSRLEEINEIIARSQVRAQQMLAGSLHSPAVVTATTVTSSAPLVCLSHQQPSGHLSAAANERRRSHDNELSLVNSDSGV